MKKYGLIGFPLGHSFSKKYFSAKFATEHIDAQYELYELPQITDFLSLIDKHNFSGLNVTIPYKEKIIPFLNELDDTAAHIGAVNVIKFIQTNGQTTLKGYNSDTIGFINSIQPHIQPQHKKALILGTGGASKAIQYGLTQLGLTTTFVSRTPKAGQYAYTELTADIIHENQVIVNATPLGTFPNVTTCPDIPYQYLTAEHLLFDVIYNPEKTLYLQRGEQQGATIVNGAQMLTGQAVAAWKIWNEQ